MITRTLTAIIMTLVLAGSGYSYFDGKLDAKEQLVRAAMPVPERIIIGLDLSLSNPLVSDKMYAAKLAVRVADTIEALPPRSEVWVRTFGAYDSKSNTLRFNEVISARNRPEKVASGLKTLITNIPTLVERGIIKGQPRTNIVGFLENMMAVAECRSDMKTTFILLTDGVEESEYADLRQASATLPASVLPATGERCEELQILGLGQGLNSPSETRRLRETWSAWAVGDGRPFLRFVGLNDW